MKMTSKIRSATLVVLMVTLLAHVLAIAQDMPRFRWENFTTANGLPDNHVFCVLVDGDLIWAGTENGLGLYENGEVENLSGPPDGLAHQAVLSRRARTSAPAIVWVANHGRA
jgi:ligand-binding sensor domain-containing protein